MIFHNDNNIIIIHKNNIIIVFHNNNIIIFNHYNNNIILIHFYIYSYSCSSALSRILIRIDAPV